MAKEDRKDERGSPWYKGWFFLIQPDSPLVTRSGVYPLETLKNLDSVDLIPNTLGKTVEDFEKPPGVYITQRKYDELKFNRQRVLASEMPPFVRDEKEWEVFKKKVAETFKDREDICIDYVKISFKDEIPYKSEIPNKSGKTKELYIVLGINYNNSITTEDYKDIMETTDVVESIKFDREHLDAKERKETPKENEDLNTHDINLI